MTPRFLILETSSRAGLVAVGEGATLIAEHRLPEAKRHARDLAPAARALMTGCGWRPADINAVVVTIGPGSYTGLRVGVMSAKAFAYATKCEVIALETFAVIAQQAPSDCGELEVIGDAQQDRIYRQRFTRASGGVEWAPVTPLAIVPLADWLSSLTNATCVSGPGLAKVASRLPSHIEVVSEDARTPTAFTLLQLAQDRFRNNRFDDVWKIEPLYLRPSAAEQQWDRRASSGDG